MDILAHITQMQYTLNVLAAVACTILSVEFIYVVRIRKSPYPWSAYSVSFVMLALACERVFQVTQQHPANSEIQIVCQTITNFVILFAAALIPIVRRGTYRRPRFQQLQEINEKLKYSQDLVRRYLEETPVAAYIKDNDRRVVHVNSSFANLFGTTVDDAIGKTNLWGDEEVSRHRDVEILEGGGQKETTESLALKNGSHNILDIRFPLAGPDNERMLGGIAVDVTGQLKRKNRIEVFASIVGLSPDAIYAYDDAGMVIAWNTAAERMFGYNREEMIGHSIDKIVPEDKRTEVRSMIEAFRISGARFNLETDRIDRNGVRKPVLLATAHVRVPEHETTSVAVVARDVSEKKLVEQHIKDLHNELELRVRELSKINSNLQKARDEALESASMKSAFVANISHELRTPLAGILGMSELLLQSPIDDDTDRMISMLHESAQSLLLVVDDILDLAKLEAGKASVERTVMTLRTFVHDCTKLFSAAASTKSLDMRVSVANDVPERIFTDPSIIRQVLLNLLANALKFTKQGGISVDIVVGKSDDGRKYLRFAVTDSGVGMDENQLRSLLTPFAHTTRPDEGMPGAGLGLVISKRFVELLGGQIDCESQKDKGSTFWFTVPLVAAEEKNLDTSQPVQLAIPMYELTRLKVLSVDDSPVVSKLTIRQLAIIGVQAEAAVNAIDAIERVRVDNFDIILMDVHLPDLTGYEAAQEIRKIEKEQNKPPAIIIALTGCSTAGDREEAASAGMDDFLTKPVAIDLLRTRMLIALAVRKDRSS